MATHLQAVDWREDRVGTLIKQAWHWRIACFLSLLLNIPLLILYIMSVKEAALTPHIIQVDPGGHVIWQGRPGGYQLEDAWILTALQDWMLWVRRRPGDLVVLREDWQHALRMTTGEATTALQQYFQAENPSDRSRQGLRVQVQPRRVLKLGKGTSYQLEWDETWTNMMGQAPQTRRWSAYLTIELKPSTSRLGLPQLTAADLARSPLGIYVSEFSVTEELQEDRR